jgi:hypothetical protein
MTNNPHTIGFFNLMNPSPRPGDSGGVPRNGACRWIRAAMHALQYCDEKDPSNVSVDDTFFPTVNMRVRRANSATRIPLVKPVRERKVLPACSLAYLPLLLGELRNALHSSVLSSNLVVGQFGFFVS